MKQPGKSVKKGLSMAMDFAQQIIGIVNPGLDGNGCIVNKWHPEPETQKPFNPSDINHVLYWITNWCDEAGCTFTISYALNEHVKDCLWNVEVAGFVGAGDDLCSALMRAVLYANQEIQQDRICQP